MTRAAPAWLGAGKRRGPATNSARLSLQAVPVRRSVVSANSRSKGGDMRQTHLEAKRCGHTPCQPEFIQYACWRLG